ncbi:MAG: NUDIX domain-containing protein [Desulfurellaceae bacterium]|nr:NUDIX domain-containing protein [Desulfurellaceae bacterium]
MPIPERYNRGYNLGVGGAVVRDNRLLLVRRASRRGRGNWQVPGGFVEPDETIERAVVREVREESGVTGEVQGVVGLRNRCDPDIGNSLYIVLLMKPLSGEPQPDMDEVDRAEYLTLEQIEGLEQVPPINREIASRVLSEKKCLLAPQELIHLNGKPYTLFVG